VPLGQRVLDPLVLGVDLLLPSQLQCAAEQLVVEHVSWLNPGPGYAVERLGAELGLHPLAHFAHRSSIID
jgi:hypothetical protein